MIGKTLSHYRIEDEISRGGIGVVYRALDAKFGREVAVKVLPPEVVADPDRKKRFVKEARSAAALENPHIGVIYEMDEAEGTTFIVMELIRGEKLSELLRRGRLSVARIVDLSVEIAEGLAHVHERGIVHRDLKPANVMVTEDGRQDHRLRSRQARRAPRGPLGRDRDRGAAEDRQRGDCGDRLLYVARAGAGRHRRPAERRFRPRHRAPRNALG